MSVQVIGAACGQRLRGLTAEEGGPLGLSAEAIKSVDGAVLRICQGSICARAGPLRLAIEACGGLDGFHAKVGAKNHITASQARLLLTTPGNPVQLDGVLLGCTKRSLAHDDPSDGSRVVICQCAPSWTDRRLHEARDNQTPLSFPQLGALFHEAQADNPEHPGFLTLRPHLWTHALGAIEVTEDLARAIGSTRMDAQLRDSSVAAVAAAANSIEIAAHASLDFELATHGVKPSPAVCGHSAGWAARSVVKGMCEVYHVATNPKPGAVDRGIVCIAVPVSAPASPKLEDILYEFGMRYGGNEEWLALRDYYVGVYLDGEARDSVFQAPLHRCLDALLHPSMHQSDYKSLLQKLFRFKPSKVTGIRGSIDDPEVECDAGDVLALVVAVGVTKRGDCFNPDLAKFIRGQVAIMKRLAITIVEDGGVLVLVPELLALALAASEVDGYNLSANTVAHVMYDLCDPLNTDNGRKILDQGVIRWRSDAYYAELEPLRTTVPIPDAPPAQRTIRRAFGHLSPSKCENKDPDIRQSWKAAAKIVDCLGAFPGDKAMMHKAADMIVPDGSRNRCYKVDVLSNQQFDLLYPDHSMPFLHFIDHHCSRDPAYALPVMIADNVREREPHRRSGEPRSAIRTESDGGGGFEARHKQFWEKCSKYDPRVHPFAFDENDPGVREVRAAQQLTLAVRLGSNQPERPLALASGDGAPCTRRRTLELELDVGTFAAGIGPVDNITVVTTREQNQNDGMADPDAMTRWRLVCCLAPDGSKIVATHKPTQHAGGNLKKPRPTATVERLAEQAVLELAKTKGLPFKSSSLPDYTRAWFFERGGSDEAAAAAAEGEEPGVWVLQRRGERRSDLNPQDSLCWSFDEEVPNTLAIDLLKIPQPAGWPHTTGEVFHSQACALDAATYRGPRLAIVSKARQAVVNLVGQLTVPQRRRLVGFLRQKYDVVRLPAPSLQGGMGSDETDRALPGDWCVARALLLISRLVPAALRPDGSLIKFTIPDPNVLRIVEGWVHSLVEEAPTPRQVALRAENMAFWRTQLQRIDGAMSSSGAALMDYQRDVLAKMQERDQRAVPEAGHFVALDVGMGKTLLGIYYLVQHLAATGCGGQILWFTDRAVVDSHRRELAIKWGLQNVAVLNGAGKDNAFALLKSAKILIVPYSKLSSGCQRDELTDALVARAAKGVCCFDETHLLYNSGVVRNAAAMRVAVATPKFIMMTATPVGSKAQKLAVTWLSLSASFEVNYENMMVASARMLAARVKLPFEEFEKVVEHAVDPSTAADSLEQLRGGSWPDAARTARDATNPRLCQTAISSADLDRAEFPDGGTFLVAENNEHATTLLEYTQRVIARRDPQQRFRVALRGSVDDDSGLLADSDPSVGIVIGVLNSNVGFNLERLGHMVIGVYASNAAARYQIRGRIKRMTQKHTRLTFTVVVPMGTVLQLLHERQLANDARANAIHQIGEEWLLQQQMAQPQPGPSSAAGDKRGRSDDENDVENDVESSDGEE